MKITVKDILSKKPCEEWTEKRIGKFIGKGKTLAQICQMEGVEMDDRIWCVTKFLDDKINRAFAIWCARQCKTDKKEITDYIDTIERYYNGKANKEELNAAYGAAYRAADMASARYRSLGARNFAVAVSRFHQSSCRKPCQILNLTLRIRYGISRMNLRICQNIIPPQ